MPRATSTVAEVFRRAGATFRAHAGATLSTAQRRVMTAIEQCRTAALGGHVEQCDHCGLPRQCFQRIIPPVVRRREQVPGRFVEKLWVPSLHRAVAAAGSELA